jgi:hypothetical protein
MELPHWLMAVGAILLVVGIVGVSLNRTAQAPSEKGRPVGPPQLAASFTPDRILHSRPI